MLEHCGAMIQVTFVGAGSIEFTRNVVTASASRREALAGARYVINEVQVGGYDAT